MALTADGELRDLFPDEHFRLHMAVRAGSAKAYFQPTGTHATLLAERRRWLRHAPGMYSAFLPECAPLLDECIALAIRWRTLSDTQRTMLLAQPSAAARCRMLGEIWEPDFLLLKADAHGSPRLLGGCVAFPSSWSLEEKIGQTIESIHGPVPQLNAQLGRSIQSFLSRLSPGQAWLRYNWGLSHSPELNQHPARGLARLDGSVIAADVWLRVERQAIVALPESGGILFGIRIENHALRAVAADTIAAERLARALETMPAEIARYKGVASARERIIELLQENKPARHPGK